MYNTEWLPRQNSWLALSRCVIQHKYQINIIIFEFDVQITVHRDIFL